MFDRILEINKKDAGAINHVIGFCGMDEELILLEEDLFLMKKFVQLFSPIKKKSDILSGEVQEGCYKRQICKGFSKD